MDKVFTSESLGVVESKHWVEMTSLAQQGDLEKLLNQNFPVLPEASFFSDFPVWDIRHGVPIVRYGIYEGDTLLASASGRIAELASPLLGKKIGIIGAVVTAVESRGKGLASEVVSRVTAELEKQNVTATLLWSAEHSLYSKLDFIPFGKQIRICLRDLVGGIEAANPQRGFTPGLIESLKRRTGGLLLSERDLPWITSHRHIEWFWTGRNDNPEAYVAIGKGMDLINIVHEWGGKPESLRRLLAYLYQKNPDAEILGSPKMISDVFGVSIRSSEMLCLARGEGKSEIEKNLWLWGLDSA